MFDLKKVPLPDYTRKEDIINCLTHVPGAVFFAVATVPLVRMQLAHNQHGIQIFGALLYMMTTMIVFLGSAIYHGMKPSYAKRVARVVDHSNIYLMISGSITSMIISNYEILGSHHPGILLSVIWVCTVIGIVLTFMDLKRFNAPQIVMYVLMGWTSMFGMREIYRSSDMGRKFAVMILVAGAIITAGSVVYFVGKKVRYCHAVFHVAVLTGAVIIYAATYWYHNLAYQVTIGL